MFELFESRNERYLRQENERSRYKNDKMEKRIEEKNNVITQLTREHRLLSSIAMQIVGKCPSLQRQLGEHYKRYAEQHEFPDVRDLILALLQIPTTISEQTRSDE